MNATRSTAAIALAGMLVFLATGVAAQCLRPDLDWVRVPNCGGRWFVWDGAHFRLGDRLHLVDDVHATVQQPGQL